MERPEATMPTIDAALAGFLAEQEAALRPKAFRNAADIIELLQHSLNGYAYESLNPFERRRWEQAVEAGDEEAFTTLFGPEKIPEHLGEFLGYFMIHKVIAPLALIAAAGPVTKDLVLWLGAQGWIEADAVTGAVERAAAATRDLPRAERLGRLLGEQAQRTDIDPTAFAEADYVEDFLTIEQVQATALWFAGGIGPVPVSATAARLAQPGWSVNIVLGRTAGTWHVLEVGSVYP
ncbi:MAG: hypothetical protein ACP5VP_10550 [Candidatus Limnocylindrales bacterium]